jgi:hypothetical protein
MAKPLKNESDQPSSDNVTAKHNVKSRDAAIADAMESLYKSDKEIRAALEKHVTPHREDKTAVKKKLREDYELTTDVINARYASYKIERKAEENGDDATIDNLREMFRATPVGGSVNFIDAMQQGAAAE